MPRTPPERFLLFTVNYSGPTDSRISCSFVGTVGPSRWYGLLGTDSGTHLVLQVVAGTGVVTAVSQVRQWCAFRPPGRVIDAGGPWLGCGLLGADGLTHWSS